MNNESRRAFLRRAVRPTLFSATLHPEFIPALVLANLMTPRLWEWAEKLTGSPDWNSSGTVQRLKILHRFLNKRFYHPEGTLFGRIWGLQERVRIDDPEEREASDYSMRMIEKSLRSISDPNYWTFSFVPFMKHGQFPLYVYPTVDIIAALSALAPENGKPPLGMTCCLDECVLAASLALAAGICRRDDFAFYGSPVHYTLMVRTDDGPVWFNAKRECFTCGEWAATHNGLNDSQRAEAFYDRLFLFDRIITASDCMIFPDGPIHGSHDHIGKWVQEAESLIGAPIAWMHADPGSSHRTLPHFGVFPQVDAQMGSTEFERTILQNVRAKPSPLLDAALCAFRHPQWCDESLLADAAERGFYVRLRAAGVIEESDADDLVEAIPGRESIFGTSARIALPDEVLAFQTASPSERSLLRNTLLRLSLAINPE